MDYEELSPEAAEPRLAALRIIDVREPHEIEGPLGIIEGALPVPLSEIEERAVELAGFGPLLLVCRSGKRSAAACERLFARGCRDLNNLVGGMIAWNQAGLPVRRKELRTLPELQGCLVAWFSQVSGTSRADAHAVVEALLPEEGSAREQASVAAFDRALESIAERLRAAGPPQDLDLTLDALRRDLAVL